jgi:nucleoside phosphorylase
VTPPTFLTPLGIEAVAVRRGARGAKVERVGMGPVKATAARVRIDLAVPADRPLVLVGLGGGLVGGATAGEVIVGSSIQLLDGEEEIALDGSEQVVDALREAGLRARVAPIVSSPRILHGADARAAAARRGAHVVDMETYWCAPLAETHPFAVCRVLSDVPGQDLWSLRTPSAMVRALRVIGTVARTLSRQPSTTVAPRSVEEADL